MCVPVLFWGTYVKIPLMVGGWNEVCHWLYKVGASSCTDELMNPEHPQKMLQEMLTSWIIHLSLFTLKLRTVGSAEVTSHLLQRCLFKHTSCCKDDFLSSMELKWNVTLIRVIYFNGQNNELCFSVTVYLSYQVNHVRVLSLIWCNLSKMIFIIM